MPTYLITGAAGFIGSNFVHLLAEHDPDTTIIAIDNLSFAANLDNLRTIPTWGEKIVFFPVDISHYDDIVQIYAQHRPDYVVNFAAESHNDRAIISPTEFMRANALGAQIMLECSRNYPVAKHVHISTIEVYGELSPSQEFFNESSPLNAKTPYSASKAAGDHIVRAYMYTYPQMRIALTHCANNYGPYQMPEKIVPLAITQIMQGKKVPLYGDGLHKRDWLHVHDHCRAIMTILVSEQKAISADAIKNPSLLPIFDISAQYEITNYELLTAICTVMGIAESDFDHVIEYVVDRPNHDRRYLINPEKIISQLGWKPAIEFSVGLSDTVNWYWDNSNWWKSVVTKKNLISNWDNFHYEI